MYEHNIKAHMVRNTKTLTYLAITATIISGLGLSTPSQAEETVGSDSVNVNSLEPTAKELNTLQELGLTAQPQDVTPTDEQPVVLEESPRLIITYKQGTAKDTNLAEEVVSDAVDQEAETVKESVAGQDKYKVIEVDKALGTAEQEEAIKALKEADPNILSVEKDAVITNVTASLKGSSETYWNQQWDKHLLGVQKAWDLGVTGKGATLGVLDTGYTNHPDLDSNRIAGADLVTAAWAARDGDGRDMDARDMGTWSTRINSSWHGTNVASIAVSPINGQGIAGVAPESKYADYRVLSYDDNGMVTDIADGIYLAAGGKIAGMPQRAPVSVINMSMSYRSTCSPHLQNAINYATGKNIPVIIAAGNNGTPAMWNSPGNCMNVITVGATAKISSTTQVLTGYSNYGSAVDIVAPGGAAGNSIFQAGNFGLTTAGTPAYIYRNGTSMATPQVAGTALLLKQINPNFTVAQIKSFLLNNSDNVSGYKSLNTEKAVRAALSATGRSSLNAPAPAPAPQNNTVNGYKLVGAIGVKYYANRSLLGVPTTNEYAVRNGGMAQQFSNGYVVYWSEASGAHIMNMNGVIFDYFKKRNYEAGFGFPTSDQYKVNGGVAQNFRLSNGLTQTIYFNNATTTANHVWNPGGIGSYYNRNGGAGKFGVPTTGEIQDGGIVYQDFAGRGRITWSPESGTHFHVKGGSIYWKMLNSGGYARFGAPSTDEHATPDGKGAQLFTKKVTPKGTAEHIFVWSESTGTHFMNSRGAIYHTWLNQGGVRWGYPVSSEARVSDGTVTVKFNNGKVIKWTEQRGTWITNG